MSQERHLKTKEIVGDALERPLSERDAFIVEKCGDDVELLADVRRLVARSSAAKRFEPPPASEIAKETQAFGDQRDPLRFGEYRVTGVAGEGGSGKIYRAVSETDGKVVAIKVLTRGAQLSNRLRERFRREGNTGGRLNHPHIVPTYEYVETADIAYIVMAFIEGRNLAEEMTFITDFERGTTKTEEGLLSLVRRTNFIEVAAGLVADIAMALHHAHERDYIHRDVKPQNILIDKRGRAYLADFGLARDATQETITIADRPEGTVYYMSPEQIAAKKNTIDKRTDIYSLGVVLYELLGRRLPFEGKTEREVMRSISAGSTTRLQRVNPKIPPELASICEKAMHRHRDDRYATAKEFAEDLYRFLRRESIPPRRLSFARRCFRFTQRHPIVVGASALVLLVGWVTKTTSDHFARTSDMEFVEKSLSECVSQFGEIGAAERRQRLEAAQSVKMRWDGLDGTTATTYATLAARHAEECDRLDQTAVDLLERAAKTGAEFDLDPPDAEPPPELSEIFSAFTRAVVTRGSISRKLEAVVESVALLSVTAEDESARGAAVFVQAINTKTDDFGDIREIGSVPIVRFPLPRGVYRIVVVDAAGDFSDSIRRLTNFGCHVEVKARIRKFEESTAGMVRITGGGYSLDSKRSPKRKQTQQLSPIVYDLPDYWIDRWPVTNGEYREFCEKTKRPFPNHWTPDPEVELPSDFWNRPCAFVPRDDARAYAEFRGKRLPFLVELDYAFRGSTGEKFPWIDTRNQSVDEFNIGREDRLGDDVLLRADGPLRIYLSAVRPNVEPPDLSLLRNGLGQPLGNVFQWTESSADGELTTTFENAVKLATVVGVSFRSSKAAARVFGLSSRADFEDIAIQDDVGFRCARSAAPFAVPKVRD